MEGLGSENNRLVNAFVDIRNLLIKPLEDFLVGEEIPDGMTFAEFEAKVANEPKLPGRLLEALAPALKQMGIEQAKRSFEPNVEALGFPDITTARASLEIEGYTGQKAADIDKTLQLTTETVELLDSIITSAFVFAIFAAVIQMKIKAADTASKTSEVRL